MTGNVSLIGNMGVTMTDIAFDPSGNLFGLSFTSLYSINPTHSSFGSYWISRHFRRQCFGFSSVFGLATSSDNVLYGV